VKKLVLILILLLLSFNAETKRPGTVTAMHARNFVLFGPLKNAASIKTGQRELLIESLTWNRYAVLLAKGYATVLSVILLVASAHTFQVRSSLFSGMVTGVVNAQLCVRALSSRFKVLSLRQVGPLFVLLVRIFT
jgi:hypothetical protein